jgi:hypothetical protein
MPSSSGSMLKLENTFEEMGATIKKKTRVSTFKKPEEHTNHL